MKQKRYITVAALLLVLLTVIAVCFFRTKSPEKSVFSLQLSAENKAQIDAAHKEWFNARYDFERPTSLAWNDIRYGVVYTGGNDGSARYYGAYGDSIVWLLSGTAQEKVEMELAGSIFNFGITDVIYVYHDDAILELTEAYLAGVLSEKDIAQVAKLHAEYEKDWQERAYISVFEQFITEDRKAQIDAAYQKKFGSQETLTWGEIRNGIVYIGGYDGSVRCYGSFGACEVFLKSGTAHEITVFSLAGADFRHGSDSTFFVYGNGELYGLEEAYSRSLLTDGDIAMIAVRHEEYERYWHERHYDAYQRELPVFDLMLTESERDAISALYSQRIASDSKIVWAQIHDGQVISSGARFYGRFGGGTLVWFMEEEGEGVTHFYIGDQMFHHPTPATFYVCVWGERLTTLEEAATRYLTEADLKMINQRHKAFNDALLP